MEKKPVSIRLSEEEIMKLKLQAEESGLSMTDYMRRCLFCNDHNAVPVIQRGKEIYQGLCSISNAVGTLEHSFPNINMDKVREGIMQVCQLLSI